MIYIPSYIQVCINIITVWLERWSVRYTREKFVCSIPCRKWDGHKWMLIVAWSSLRARSRSYEEKEYWQIIMLEIGELCVIADDWCTAHNGSWLMHGYEGYLDWSVVCLVQKEKIIVCYWIAFVYFQRLIFQNNERLNQIPKLIIGLQNIRESLQ